MQARMKAPYSYYELEKGQGTPFTKYKVRKDHVAVSVRDNKATRVSKKSIGLSLCVWYFFSTSATFTNRSLIKEHHVSAEMLTMCHLFISILLDFVVLTFPTLSTAGAWRMQRVRMRNIVWILPLSLFSVLATTLTYWSYNAVPISITQTCKASQPLFNVVLAFMAYRSRFSVATYLSVVPIVFGVVMASVSEMSINLHFYSTFMSFAINAPFVLMAARAHQENFVASFPFGIVLMCSMMHFLGSFGSSWVLGEVSELTFSIMSTMKRVVVIFSAILFFGNPVKYQSILGMALAVGGVGAYQLVKIYEKPAKLLPLSSID
ncbi:hypothetical protein CCR75_009200 [Bremia lactucae]|uniref:Sugar phosphate transporter domain-containing protein n=1 Tax=Bremia lactucae TaxID=4779 RepID=A0A976IBC9_BRELC|nr:hypothetical protein CCR75_009200 [Bremia lactucae]